MTTSLSATLPASRAEMESSAYSDTFYQLATEAVKMVQEPTYTENVVMRLMNRGMREICARLSASNVYLPSLVKTGEVTAYPDALSCRLPADWFGNLHEAFDLTVGNTLRVVTWDRLREIRSNQIPGRLHSVCVHGNALHYLRAPDNAHRLRLSYVCLPPEMHTTDRVAALPPELTPDTLLNYAAWKGYERIEQEQDSQKVQTAYHKAALDSAILTLIQEIGPWPLPIVQPEDAGGWGWTC